MFCLQNKKILVTGASGGIGREISNALSYSGASIIVSGRKQDVIDKIATDLGPKANAIRCDLHNLDQIPELITSSIKIMGGLDALVCVSGITNDKLSIRMDNESWDSVIKVNLSASFILNREAAKFMLKQRYGRIVNISSIIGYTGNSGQANYAASKAGIIAMSKSLALEFAKKCINVNCIAPGFIETQMTSTLSDEQKEGLMTKIPMNRFGKPSDIVGAVIFLLSKASDYITGQVLHINGGMLMA